MGRKKLLTLWYCDIKLPHTAADVVRRLTGVGLESGGDAGDGGRSVARFEVEDAMLALSSVRSKSSESRADIISMTCFMLYICWKSCKIGQAVLHQNKKKNTG